MTRRYVLPGLLRGCILEEIMLDKPERSGPEPGTDPAESADEAPPGHTAARR